MHIRMNKDKTFPTKLEKALENSNSLANWETFSLYYNMKQELLNDSFETLLAPKYLTHINILDHQLKAVKTVMRDMNGRAILADEVGLGKTIEAGLLLKEYLLRGQVKRVLLLVPSSLINQWVYELSDKFLIPTMIYRKGYQWSDHSILIASIDLAKRPNHQEEILQIDYDMVIVDEAHKLKNKQTKNHQFIRSIKKKYCLLLTATPVQNNILELYNLIAILKPGYLGTYQDFKKKYEKHLKVNNNHYLQQLIQKVMVRNSRKDTLINDVKRNVETIWLQFSQEEMSVYRSLINKIDSRDTLSKLTYLKELCSSREACYLSLKDTENERIMVEKEALLKDIEQLPHHVKAQKLVELIQNIGNEKVIVFTEYRATQFYLEWFLHQHDISSVSFKGGIKAGRKTWLTSIFKSNKQVFIATEAGGEGINLQFCHHLINYDLPWNPMRLEQRIGRMHRYGQKNNMHIYHFAIKDTIEEYIMKILHEKKNLFENTVGELDHILSKNESTI